MLLAARNGCDWIVEQITTILGQENANIELVISDDGSTDATLVEIGKFLQDRRVRMLSPPFPTGSASKNFFWLMRNAPLQDHDFIALADQDDIWEKEKIARGCRLLADSGAAGYSSAVTAFWSDGSEVALRQVSTATRSDFLFEGAGQGCTFVLSAAFFRQLTRFFAEQPASLSSIHYHDWTIYALARSWKKTWYFDERSMMRYRQHRSNDTGARLSLQGVKRRLGLLKDGWYRRQLSAIASICALAAPRDSLITEWNRTLGRPPSAARKLQMARFCLAGGRRRLSDNVILLVAALLGWI